MNKLSIILSLLLVVSLVIAAFGCAVEEPEEVVPEGPPIPPREEVSVDASYDGKEVWTFHAEEKGKSTISMEYRRPWEKGIEPAKTFTLTVIVK